MNASETPRRVLVLEDQPLVRDFLVGVVREVHPQADVVEAALCRHASAAIAQAPFDLALVDLGLPDGNGVTVIRQLNTRNPDTEVVVATIFDDDDHLFEAMEAGATGYLLKESGRNDLVDGLRGLARGEPALSPAVVRRMVAWFNSQPPKDAPNLTPREREVLKLIAKGLNRADIAELLNLSKNTVSDYTKAVYRKLEVSSRAEAALEAERLGLLGRRR